MSEFKENCDSSVERIVECTIHDHELMDMVGKVPLAVQIRIRLNKEGFKFEDDGNLGFVVNENPKPVGEFVQWYSVSDRATTYKQRLCRGLSEQD